MSMSLLVLSVQCAIWSAVRNGVLLGTETDITEEPSMLGNDVITDYEDDDDYAMTEHPSMFVDDVIKDDEDFEPATDRDTPYDGWEQVGEGKVCAMETVKTRFYDQFSFSLYGAYSPVKFGTEDINGAKFVYASASAISAEYCEKKALKRDHYYFAIGTNSSTGRKECFTFPECTEDKREQKDGFKLYRNPFHKEASTMDEVLTVEEMPCSAEAIIQDEVLRRLARAKLPGQEEAHVPRSYKPLATIVRAVFHDASDFNSLMAIDKSTNEWVPVDGSDEGYAGMDGCVYESPLAEKTAGIWGFKILETDNLGTMLRNTHLDRRGQNQDYTRIDRLTWAEKSCENLCFGQRRPGLFQTKRWPSTLPAEYRKILCGTDSLESRKYLARCVVDVMTFASLLIVRNAGGPHIPMTWGRRQADCRKPFRNTQVPAQLDTRRVAQRAASLSSFGRPAAIFEDFDRLGMNKSEAVALMGGHSFGKLHYYGGGVRTRQAGAGFCDDPSSVQGSFGDGKPLQPLSAQANLDKHSNPPGLCEYDNGVSCFTNERGFLEPAPKTSAKELILENEPGLLKNAKKVRGASSTAETTDLDWKRAMHQFGSGTNWGGGGFFDRTPDVFDNDYFKMLGETNPNERNNCCGPTTEFGCSTDGLPMQSKDGRTINGCEINFCLRSAGGDTEGRLGSGSPNENTDFPDYLMVSTKTYVQPSTFAIHGGNHRIVRFAADWALIDDAEARDYVKEFAADASKFNSMFAAAWSKLITLGYPEGQLKTCREDA